MSDPRSAPVRARHAAEPPVTDGPARRDRRVPPSAGVESPSPKTLVRQPPVRPVVDAPSHRAAPHADHGERSERFLVVNTADGARRVRFGLARGDVELTPTLDLEAGGHASVAAPGGAGALAVHVEAGGHVADGVGRRPPMVVVRERSVELC